jgi:hypothetical protein
MHLRILPLLAALALAGCVHVKMDPIEINANININVRLEKALEDFFGDLDAKSATIAEPAAGTTAR